MLFSERLDGEPPSDHTTRPLDEILGRIVFSAWQAEYNDRHHPGERPFAMIQHHFEVRRFLLRGLD